MLTRRIQFRRSVMKLAALVPLTAVVLLVMVRPGPAQSPDDTKALKKEIEALKDQVHKDLEDIKNLMRTRAVAPSAPAPAVAPSAPEPDPTNVVLNVDSRAPFKGAKGAKLTLVEFTDYQ